MVIKATIENFTENELKCKCGCGSFNIGWFGKKDKLVLEDIYKETE